jgi:prepilin-type N-terminal cleavage/methylation domain-containing protein
MLNRIRETRKNESGFTLIELLIVIVILGVLAGIVVFAVGGITDRGKTSACKADVKNVEIAQEAFYAKTPVSGTPAYAANVAALVTAKLLREEPDASEGITTDTTGVVAHSCSF